MFDCSGQLKILLCKNCNQNFKFKVLCLNGQLKSKQGTECELNFLHYFWHLNRCLWHFIPKQVEGVSCNLICRHYVPKRCVIYNIVQYKQFFITPNLGSEFGHWSPVIGQLVYIVRLPHGATSWEKFVLVWILIKILALHQSVSLFAFKINYRPIAWLVTRSISVKL